MSGSTALETSLTPDEQRLFDQMRADDSAPRIASEPSESAADISGAGDPFIELEEQPPEVPEAEYQAERQHRIAAERRLAERERHGAAEAARLDERARLLAAAAQAVPPPSPRREPEIPDVSVDPIGHFRAVSERQGKQLEQLTGFVNDFQNRQQNHARIRELQAWGAAQEVAFEAREPTYRDAMKHLEATRLEELTALGVTDPGERRRILGRDIHDIAVRSRQEGVDFAERLYTLAQKRGFRNGAAADRPAAAARLSLDKLANMPEREFATLVERFKKNDPTAVRRLLGG